MHPYMYVGIRSNALRVNSVLAFLGVVKPADIDAMYAFHNLWYLALRGDGLSWSQCLLAAVAGT